VCKKILDVEVENYVKVYLNRTVGLNKKEKSNAENCG
jgi:hypothetical protein